jgi:hypothetical protein
MKTGGRSLVLAVVLAFMVGFGVPVVWGVASGRLDVEVVSKRAVRRGSHGTSLTSSTTVHVGLSGHEAHGVSVSGSGSQVHRVHGVPRGPGIDGGRDVHGVCRVRGVRGAHGGRVSHRSPVHAIVAGQRVVFLSRVGFDGARRFV